MPNFNLPDSVFERAAARFPTPFFLYDEKGIRAAIHELKAAFAWAPHFMEYFAVKALPNPRILQLFIDEGFGLDCASECELLMAERVGAQGRIMFSANNVPAGEFAHANQLNAILNLDDISDIDQVLRECGRMPETVSMRLNPGGGFMSNNAIIGKPEESKYGWTVAQMREGLQRMKTLGVKRFGIHALLASNAQENGYYPALAELLMQTAYDLADESSIAPAFVNLSGGVGIPYHPGEPGPNIPLIGEGVEKAYRRIFGAPTADNTGVCTELGRHMTGPHGWLVTHAIHHKTTYRKYIGVDGCSGHLPRPAIYGAYHHVSVVGKRDAEHTEVYDVVGALCENSDKFAIQRPLPPIEMGDIVLIHDAGAHCYAMSHNYNGRLRCAEIMLREDGEFQLIRRAETPEDYFATLCDVSMEKSIERRRSLQCKVYPLNTLSPYKYVVICARYGDKWLLSRHRKRATWETQGGHIEAGETPMDAARRELYEESGVQDATLYPVCDYYGYDTEGHSNGVVFLAVIHHLGSLPESEMKETQLFDVLPEELTYPSVSPVLFAEAEKLLR